MEGSRISRQPIVMQFLMSYRFVLRCATTRFTSRLSTPLKRLKNIAQNPAVAVVVDRYEEDWGQLGWVILRGHAEILIDGREHDQAQELLRSRYPQLKSMQIAELPVIAVRIVSATSWGNLSLAKSD